MPNRRMIYQDMFEDDEIGTLPLETRFLWVGIIVAVADDQGRLLDNASLIKSKVFVYDSNITEAMIKEWLDKLESVGMIIRYTGERKKLIQIVNWWEYQTPSWASGSKYSSPDTWVDRIKVHTVGNKVKMLNWDNPGGLPTGVPTSVDKPINEVKSDGDIKSDDNNPTTTAFAVFASEIGNLSPTVSERLGMLVDDYSDQWVQDAIKEAVLNNVKKLPYIEAMLKSWKENGKGVRKKRKYNKSKDKSFTSWTNPQELQYLGK